MAEGRGGDHDIDRRALQEETMNQITIAGYQSGPAGPHKLF
jgi:hypothetical protein